MGREWVRANPDLRRGGRRKLWEKNLERRVDEGDGDQVWQQHSCAAEKLGFPLGS